MAQEMSLEVVKGISRMNGPLLRRYLKKESPEMEKAFILTSGTCQWGGGGTGKELQIIRFISQKKN